MGNPPKRPGDTVEDVFQIELDYEGMLIARRLRDDLEFQVRGMQLPLGKVTIYGAHIESIDGKMGLCIDENTEFYTHHSDDTEFPGHILELCAGFGGMGQSLRMLGMKEAASVDWNGLAVEHLGRNTQTPVLQEDLNMAEVPRKIHSACGNKALIALLGFPCQPYSTQGRGLGEHDPRARVLPRALRVIYLTQCKAVILECVVGAKYNKVVNDYLQEIAYGMNLKIENVELELAHQWPMKRHRWWVLLSPKTWNGMPLQPWPINDSPIVIGLLLNEWKTWSKDEENQLQVQEMELDKLLDPLYGSDLRQLSMQNVAPTMLHSYANMLMSCPCACRMAPFSEQSLRERGLRGYYVQSKETGILRYLHPREAMLLLGVSQRVALSTDLRADLALLGLVASPMQSLWIFAHLRCSFDSYTQTKGFPTPIETLAYYQNRILMEAREFGLPIGKTIKQQSEGERHPNDFVTIGVITESRIQASLRPLLDWGSMIRGFELQREQNCDNYVIKYEKVEKISKNTPPTGPFVVDIVAAGNHLPLIAQAGQFIFEVLRQAGFDLATHVLDEGGNLTAADQRIWRPRILHVVDGVGTPNMRNHIGTELNHTTLGMGPMMISCGVQTIARTGLSEIELKPIAEAMFREANIPLEKFWSPTIFWHISEMRLGEQDFIRWKLGSNTEAIGLMWDDHHWVLMHAQWHPEELHVTYYDGFYDIPSTDMEAFVDLLALATGQSKTRITYTKVITQTGGSHCGTVALLHLGHVLGLEVECTEEHAMRWHESLLPIWLQHDPSPSLTLSWTLTGRGPEENKVTLTRLLTEKGVPKEKAEERAQHVQTLLGNATLTQALRSRNAWAALKEASNAPGVRLRLLTHEEQDQYIQQRAATKHGAQIPNKKKAKGKPQQITGPTTLEPEQLKLDSSHFQDEQGKGVQQIHLNEVVAGSRGLAICNIQSAQTILGPAKENESGCIGTTHH